MRFTSQDYRDLITSAVQKFTFARFGDGMTSAKNIALWRHDVDFSPQRALKMAQQEAEISLTTTYFVQLSSRYYSVFEPETASVIRAIRDLGHEIGLHFDPEVCYYTPSPDLEERIRFEAGVLGQVVEKDIRIFSLHNPTTLVSGTLDEPCHAGLINASASALRASFTYCSDSNGIWRYDSLSELIANPQVTRLYALTHPEWWQDIPMSPRDRIKRCIGGRLDFCLHYYDNLLAENSRPNVGGGGDSKS